MSDVVARGKVALEGVTDGGWLHARNHDGTYVVDAKPDLTVQVVAEGIENEADAEFIASARSLVPELIAEVERLTPRRIETAEQLNALPVGSVIRDGDRDFGCVFEKSPDGEGGIDWWYDGQPHDISDISLPAALLYLPPNGAGDE